MSLPSQSRNTIILKGILAIISLVVIVALIGYSGFMVYDSTEQVQEASEALEEATTNLDNTVRSQIQKCIAKNGYDACVTVVMDYKINGCQTDETYKDLPVCNDGTLDEYLEVHSNGVEDLKTQCMELYENDVSTYRSSYLGKLCMKILS